jgi:predicted RNA binding protein YcfA (HicA-like mRNA interferase family)
MPRKIRELKEELRRAGFAWRPGKGSHQVWFHRSIPDQVTISGNDGDDAKPYLEKQVRSILEKVSSSGR